MGYWVTLVCSTLQSKTSLHNYHSYKTDSAICESIFIVHNRYCCLNKITTMTMSTRTLSYYCSCSSSTTTTTTTPAPLQLLLPELFLLLLLLHSVWCKGWTHSVLLQHMKSEPIIKDVICETWPMISRFKIHLDSYSIVTYKCSVQI